MKPYLKWAGGKRTIAPAMKKLYENSVCTRLVEPYCGALSIALGVNPESARLSDINQHLINLHIHVRDESEFNQNPPSNNLESYNKVKARFNELISLGEIGKEAAEAFYFLNRTCFNGLCRFNKSGFFNVSYGKYKSPIVLSDFSDYKKSLEKWDFVCEGYSESLKNTNSNDFVFIDSPYDGGGFVSYSESGFTADDQILSAKLAADSPSKCVLTNADTPFIRDLYSSLGFMCYQHTMPRMISCNGKRERAKEIIAFKGFSRKDIESIRPLLTGLKKIR